MMISAARLSRGLSAVRKYCRARAAEPRLVLHARMTNLYFVMMFIIVTAVVPLAGMLWREWRSGHSQGLAGFVGAAIFMLAMATYCERKARWLVARPNGLTIIERRRVRVVSWADVTAIDDLGRIGGGPGARRYYLELRDGYAFTFLGDPEAMALLESVRPALARRARAPARRQAA